ncbi:SpoIIE family protein phosphatase [Streptomyces sp. NPDC004647]|uniref:SpoIIE family protein phosphatase n=1 Tax=Streptomyces sp. NPDC004647 TaxID=3154671 RepID=UPI00339E23B4
MSAGSTAENVDFRGPLDVTRAATVVLDAQDVVIGWSPMAEQLLGYPPREILGHRLDTLLVGRPTEEPELIRLLESAPGRLCHSEARIARHRDGHVLQVATTVCALAVEGQGPSRILVAADLEPLRLWEAHQAMLRGLATQSPVGLGIYDTDLRVSWANTAYGEEIGRPLEEFIGKRTNELYARGEVVSPGYPSTIEEVMRYVLATGEPVVDLLYRGRPPVDPDNDHVWSCSYYRLEDARGHVLGVCEDAFDITERYRAQQRLALMVRAGVRIGTTLDMVTTARQVTEVVIPQFADSVTVDLMEGVLEGEEPRAEGRPAPSLLRIVEQSGPVPDGAEAEEAAEAAEAAETAEPFPQEPRLIGYAPESPQARALSSGKAVREDSAKGAGISGLPGVHSRLVVPLRARGTTMGLVTFLRSHTPAPFDNGELTLADELVTRTALSVDNARRFTRERTASRTLQRSLLPRRLPGQSAVEAAYRYLPADDVTGVGGDWFDVIALSGTRVGLVVGDVVGHGVHAAATMGRLRTTVRALARLDLSPDELLSRLDDLVLQGAEERATEHAPGFGPEDDEGLGVTCLYAVYDPVSRLCSMARAGHLPPAVVDPDGRFFFPDVPPGPPLGLGGLPFESLDIQLPEGSLVALFTGGLVEARDRDIDIGVEALRGVLSDHRSSLEELCDRALTELLPGGPTKDDAALLLVRTRKLGSQQVAVWELEAEPEAVAQARAMAMEQLVKWGLEELSFTTELVVSELVTNAIRHATGPVHLRLIRDRTLLCEVSDGGHTSPHLRHSASDDEGGRGLFIVAQMVQRWGTRYTQSGKTIWTEQAFPDGELPAPQAL